MPATKDIHSKVILVNEQNLEIGLAEKLAAHQQGLLHRAFSIFIFRQPRAKAAELLLQQRADTKYHSPGLWTNTCCSHPSPGENILEAAKRRLNEEFNIKINALEDIGQFHYTAHFKNGLIENELDHVLIGLYTEASISPNPAEIKAYRWVSLDVLKNEMAQEPEKFTAWLGRAVEIVEAHYSRVP